MRRGLHRLHILGVLCTVVFTFSPGLSAQTSRPADDPLVLSGPLEDRIQLVYGWRYHPGDDPEWADPAFDDSGWPVAASLLPTDEPPPGGWPDIGWFRRRLVLAEDMPPTALAFRVEQMGASELYLDGRLVSRTGTVSADPATERPVYPNDFGGLALAPGRTHLLAIRYSNSRGNLFSGIGAGFAVNIRSVESAAASYGQWSRIVITMPSAFAGAFTALAVLHLLLYAFRRKSPEHLFFALFAATVVTGLGFEMLSALETDLIARLQLFKLQVASAVAMVLVGLVLVHVVFRRRPSWLTWAVVAAGAVMVVWVGTWDAFLSTAPLRVFFVVAFLEMLRVSAFALFRREPDAWIVAAAFALMAATTIVAAGARMLGRPLSSDLTGNLSLAVVGVAFSVFITRRAARTARELEQRLTEVRVLSERALEQERRAIHEEGERRLLEAAHRRRSEELEAARRLQLAMLPQRAPEVPGVDIAYRMVTATEVGGDYVDFRLGDSTRTLVAFGDATSHGLQAGMVVAMAKSLFHSVEPDSSPAEVLARIGSGLQDMRERYASMAMAVASIDHGGLEIASAGMPPILIRRAATGNVDEVLMSGVPLGTLAATSYEVRHVLVMPGDAVLMMSDGVIEAIDAGGEPFGYDRAAAYLASCACESAEDLVAGLMDAVARYTDGAAPGDDVTVLALAIG